LAKELEGTGASASVCPIKTNRKDDMKTYKITAGETIYAVYKTEIKAKDKKQAEKIASEQIERITR